MTRNPTAQDTRTDAIRSVERLAEKRLNDTRFDRLRPRRTRRALVIAWAVMTAICVGVVAIDEPISSLAALVVGAGCVWLLRVVVRAVVDLPSEVLDERQDRERDRTYRTAYTILVTLVMIASLAIYVAHDATRFDWNVTSGVLNALFVGVLLVGLGLPSAVFAWNQDEV